VHVAVGDTERIVAEIEQFHPDVLHGHYVHHAAKMREVAQRTGLPFTVRAHSYDVLGGGGRRTVRYTADLNDDLCLGVLTFPFTVDRLVRTGVKEDKIVPCRPVVDVDLFADNGPNGSAVMNVGACLPKKNHHLFIDLADYVGPGAYLFDTLDEVVGIIASPLPEYRRQQGFTQARSSDIKAHLPLLEALWKRR